MTLTFISMRQILWQSLMETKLKMILRGHAHYSSGDTFSKQHICLLATITFNFFSWMTAISISQEIQYIIPASSLSRHVWRYPINPSCCTTIAQTVKTKMVKWLLCFLTLVYSNVSVHMTWFKRKNIGNVASTTTNILFIYLSNGHIAHITILHKG